MILIPTEELQHFTFTMPEDLTTIAELIQNQLSWSSSKAGPDECERVVILGPDVQLHFIAQRFRYLYTTLHINNQLMYRYKKHPAIDGEWKIATLCSCCGTVVSVGKERIPGLSTLRLDNLRKCWDCWWWDFYY